MDTTLLRKRIEETLNNLDYIDFLERKQIESTQYLLQSLNQIESTQYLLQSLFPDYVDLYQTWGEEILYKEFQDIFERWDSVNYRAHCL